MKLQLIRDPRENRTSTKAERDIPKYRDCEMFIGKDWRKDIDTILDFQREDGSFSLYSDYRMDSDCRVFYVYRPTYWCCQILIKMVLAGYGDDRIFQALKKGLAFSCGRGLNGHGFDDLEQQLEDVQDFINCGLVRFLDEYPDCNEQFTEMIGKILECYRIRIANNQTTAPFGNDVSKEMKAIVAAFEPEACLG